MTKRDEFRSALAHDKHALQSFFRGEVKRGDKTCAFITIMICCMVKFFFSVNVIRELKATWRFALPAYAMFPSAVEVIYGFFFTARRETRVWVFWLLRILAFSALASSVACFLLGRDVREGTLEDMLAGFLGVSVLEFCVSTFWACRFWRTPSIRVYAPVCVKGDCEDADEEYRAAGSGTLSQLYEKLSAEPQPRLNIEPVTSKSKQEASNTPALNVSRTSALLLRNVAYKGYPIVL